MAIVTAQPKWIGKSMTIWGSLIAVAATAYQVLGPILDAVGVTVPITPQDIQDAGNVGGNVITAVTAAAGLVLTWWGRFRSGTNVQPISLTPNAPKEVVTITTPPAVPKSTG